MRHPLRFLPSILACLLIAAAFTAWAAAPAPPPTASPTFWGELLAILIPLAFIILALLLALRHIRRRYGLTGQDTPLSVVQILPVGPRERVVLVRSRSGRVLAIGVGAQSVGLIAELDAEDIAPPPGAGAPEPPSPAAKRTFFGLMRSPQGPGTR